MSTTADGATITVGNVGYKPTVYKQPGEARFYFIDFTNYLNDQTGVDISTVVVVVNPVNPNSPTIDTPSIISSSKVVKVLISAGVNKYIGTVTCRATFSDTQIKEQEFDMVIREIDA